VFEPAPQGTRKVVLATNIAETSLTIPGIRYVVDPGLVKARAFNPRSGVDTLAVQPVSQAQARQRAGRAGREAPGKVLRLYMESTFFGLPHATVPEIKRANLGSVVLQLKALGVQSPLDFPFVDAPPRDALVRSLELLYALEALDDDGTLTTLGTRMARFPLDPMAARAALYAADTGCADTTLAVLAMLSTDGAVFFAPRERRAEAAEAKKRFLSPEGDHSTLLKVFRDFAEQPARRRGQWARDNFVNVRSLGRAMDVHAQLMRVLAQEGPGGGAVTSGASEDTEPMRRALAAGYFLHAARLMPDKSFRVLNGGATVAVHPASALFHVSKPPAYVLFNQMVRTSKLYVRDACAIEPAWLAELAPRFFRSSGGHATATGAGGAAHHPNAGDN